MPSNRTIVQQTKEEQKRVFRLACDQNRYGMTLKAIAMDAGIGYDSLRDYASGETEMPLSALRRLIGVVPDDLLSLLLPDGRFIVQAPGEIDHDVISAGMRAYLKAKDEAHHPNSEAGRDIGPGEHDKLCGHLTVVSGSIAA